jgi:hypothetical protein
VSELYLIVAGWYLLFMGMAGKVQTVDEAVIRALGWPFLYGRLIFNWWGGRAHKEGE